ncbi:MAG: ISAs1 family transposase [Kangiellaceae bacterium]|jgi:predicted transposase YbfD/YdcC|nr:ISAs1 family transposase [Kangiellaceae bacterium]
MTMQELKKTIETLKIDEPRQRIKRILHSLNDIIVITICAVICGCESWEEIEDFGKYKKQWLLKYLDLPNGIPSHDTFSRVFSMLKPEELMKIFTAWTHEIRELDLESTIAIDGKTLCGSTWKNEAKSQVHIVNAYSTEEKLTLAQVKVNEKSNEIKAIPELLNALKINGKIITIDAMGTQKKIAEQIIKQNGEYILSLKQNHKNMYDDIAYCFSEELSGNIYDYDEAISIEKNHGRIEKRKCTVIYTVDWLESYKAWKNLNSIIMVERVRIIDNKETKERSYYLSSLKKSAEKLLNNIRNHWKIENNLHWTLDVVFKEDCDRKRKANEAENFSLVRKLVLNLLNTEKTKKISLKRKQRLALMDEKYLEKIIFPKI